MEEVVVQMLNLKLMNPSGDHRRGNKFGHIVKVNILRAVPAQRPPAAYKIQRHLLTLKAPLSIHQQGQHKYSATGSKRNNAMTGLLQLAILLQTQQQITSLMDSLKKWWAPDEELQDVMIEPRHHQFTSMYLDVWDIIQQQATQLGISKALGPHKSAIESLIKKQFNQACENF
ncbi:hypothetical protein SERLA73DRAFT_75040 [Serpula lacrymans var. lacrymans S7.3]|uniref:Uncharacterized protein n=1 Tax=Serpula lacrymans var. lacrymans (strain S7.3) TaxID=936435 RepID=F8Q2C8_SERL3|nr:hypothetical protein SERLA73DRAFT_75040 [Serpula lacrymans var. lacrymans S7.3]